MLGFLFWKDRFSRIPCQMCPQYFVTLTIGLKSCLCGGMKAVVPAGIKNTWQKLYPCSLIGKKLFYSPQNHDVLEEENAKKVFSNVQHFWCTEEHLRMTSGPVLAPFPANSSVGQKMQLWPALTMLYSSNLLILAVQTVSQFSKIFQSNEFNLAKT